MILLPMFALSIGCAPADAEITGNYAAFLAYGSSPTLKRVESDGATVAEQAGDIGAVPIDCRDLSALEDDVEAATRLPGVDYEAECANDPQWFTWLSSYPYYKLEDTIEGNVWRTEAVLVDGDLQLTAHVNIPGLDAHPAFANYDFRFGWVIDPDFQPVICADDGAGGSAYADVDGNWLENWSEGEDGTLWHLNTGAIQYNPNSTDTVWSFTEEWSAGLSYARLADEVFLHYPTDYADPDGAPLYHSMYNGAYLPNPPRAYADWVTEVRDAIGGSAIEDLSAIGKSSFPLDMKIENNAWRPVDDDSAGLDGWVGVGGSWVRIDNPQDIAVGRGLNITGSFQIYLQSDSGATRLLVGGDFVIDRIRDDVWGYHPTLEQRKYEENETKGCEGEALASDE